MQESVKVKQLPDLRRYFVNDNYDFNTHNGAWLLGFIAADGYLPNTKGAKNRITISLALKDEEILKIIAKELSYTGKLFYYESNGFPAVSLSFASKTIRAQIEKYGIGNNKTFQLHHLPKLSEEFIIDFIRGYFDGDGSIYEPQGKRININFTCACKNFLKEIGEFLHQKYNLAIPTIHESFRVNPVYDIRYYVKDSLELCSIFYENNYLALPRKKNHYLKIKNS